MRNRPAEIDCREVYEKAMSSARARERERERDSDSKTKKNTMEKKENRIRTIR